jgi:hypothetical protein
MLTDEELQDALDDLMARGWYTNHGPMLAGFEQALDGQWGWAGAAGVCSVAAGVFLWAAAVEQKTPIWVHPTLPDLRGAALLHPAPLESPPEGATVLLPAALLRSDSPRCQLGVINASDIGDVDLRAVASMAAAVLIETGTTPQSRSLGAPGGVVLVRDPLHLQALRTARNHHSNQTFAAVPLRFNSKMSEIQAVAAAVDLLTAEAARALLRRLSPVQRGPAP